MGRRLINGSEDRIRLVLSLDQLPLLDVGLGIVERFQNHRLHLFVAKPVCRLYLDLGLAAAALLSRRNLQDAIGIDEEFHLDARQTGAHRWNALQIKARQRTAIFGEFTLTLDDMDS